MNWEAKKLDDTYSGIYKNGELVRVNVETTDAEFFVEALAACAAGEWRTDVENAPKYVWVSVWYAEHPDDWFKARLNGDDCWETGLYLKTRTPDAFAVPNPPQVTT